MSYIVKLLKKILEGLENSVDTRLKKASNSDESGNCWQVRGPDYVMAVAYSRVSVIH